MAAAEAVEVVLLEAEAALIEVVEAVEAVHPCKVAAEEARSTNSTRPK